MAMELTPENLAKMLGDGGGRSRRKKSSEKIMFPKDKVVGLLELMQAAHDTEKGSGRSRSLHNMWDYIHEHLPITCGRVCSIDQHNATVLYIRVGGPCERYEVGGRTEEGHTILAVYPILPENRYRIMELSDLEESGPLHRYKLWSYIAEIFPDMPNDGTQRHTLVSTSDWMGVITVEDEEDGA